MFECVFYVLALVIALALVRPQQWTPRRVKTYEMLRHVRGEWTREELVLWHKYHDRPMAA